MPRQRRGIGESRGSAGQLPRCASKFSAAWAPKHRQTASAPRARCSSQPAAHARHGRQSARSAPGGARQTGRAGEPKHGGPILRIDAASWRTRPARSGRAPAATTGALGSTAGGSRPQHRPLARHWAPASSETRADGQRTPAAGQARRRPASPGASRLPRADVLCRSQRTGRPTGAGPSRGIGAHPRRAGRPPKG